MNKKTFLLVIALLVAGQFLVAQVDPATLNLGPNLLANPGFETIGETPLPMTVNANNGNTIEGWTLLSADWLKSYYYPENGNNGPSIIHTGPGADNAFFSEGGNGAFFTSSITGDYVLRLSGGNPGGFYQVVSVESGATYFFSIDMGISATNDNQVIREDGSLKITRNFDPDGPEDSEFKSKVFLYEVPIPAVGPKSDEPQVFTDNAISGVYEIPEGIDEVRFLIDRPNFPAPSASPLYLYDNCRFQKINQGSGILTLTGNDPVVSTRYYTVEGVEIANPPVENGIYIVRKTLQSGKVVVDKKLGIRN